MSTGASASITAVIAAAGSGERLGAGGPKALVPLAGRPMVEWSIEAFRAAGVAAIVVAAPPAHAHKPAPLFLSSAVRPKGTAEAGASSSDAGDLQVVAGGETRSQSVSNALEAVETELVAIHDAARPLVTSELIQGVVATLTGDPDAAGAIAATAVTDTIKRAPNRAGSTNAALATEEGENAAVTVDATLDRAELWAAQTPQVFRVEALRAALAAAGPDALAAATDEAMLVEGDGGRVLIHPAPAENLKVTTPLDLELAERLLAARSVPG